MAITKRVGKRRTVYVVDERTAPGPDGKRTRVRVTCRTMSAAKAEQARIIAERDAMGGRGGRITLRAYVERWYYPTLDRLAASSRGTYRRDLEKRVLPALGNMDLRQIGRAQVQSMVSACPTRAVARKALNTLRTVLNCAMQDGLLRSNPASFRYVMPSEGSKRDNGVVIGTFAAMRPVLDAVDADGGPCVEKLAVTGLLMGLRPEERYGLDWGDVDWDAGTVSIRRAYTAVGAADGSLDLKEPKTEQSRRTVPLGSEALSRLERLWESEGRPDGPLITGAKGGRVSPSTARHRWQAFLRRHPELPQVTLENMRHSYATSFLAAGGRVEVLSRLLGHSDINTTYRRYVRPDIEAIRASVEQAEMGLGAPRDL